MSALLKDIIVIDFSQFLSGPSASLRMADLGAHVIKIEKPGTGDICRQLYVSDVRIEGESTIFHAINRNKQSYVADLKAEKDLEKIKALLKHADVMIHNFRPGVMQRLGLDYEQVQQINPKIIYAAVSGYGTTGPWKDLPGQDLLLQGVSGMMWLSGDRSDPPTPMGVAVVDILAGTHLTQGILAALYRRGITGKGGLVEVSMLESALDFQFEALTCFYNDGEQIPERSSVHNAHAYVGAPYGIYQTSDAHLALAMTSIPQLGKLIRCPSLESYVDAASWFNERDQIKGILAKHLLQQSTAYWLQILEQADIWCAPVYDYEAFRATEGYQALQMEHEVRTANGLTIATTRCPIRVDGQILTSDKGAPLLGAHNTLVDRWLQQKDSIQP